MSRTALVALVIANLFVALQTLRLGLYNVRRMLIVGVAGAAPLGAWAARHVFEHNRLAAQPPSA